jgi:hypothetical protein
MMLRIHVLVEILPARLGIRLCIPGAGTGRVGPPSCYRGQGIAFNRLLEICQLDAG